MPQTKKQKIAEKIRPYQLKIESHKENLMGDIIRAIIIVVALALLIAFGDLDQLSTLQSTQ